MRNHLPQEQRFHTVQPNILLLDSNQVICNIFNECSHIYCVYIKILNIDLLSKESTLLVKCTEV